MKPLLPSVAPFASRAGLRAGCWIAWGLLALPVPLLAQGTVVATSLSITETITDNRDLAATGRQTDLVTQISPGLAITAKRGALQGSLAYTLNGVAYARDTSKNNVYHSLSSEGRMTFLDGRLGIDGTASAGRQVISAYETQPTGATGFAGNQAQVVSYSLSPYLTGRLLGDVSYRVRTVFAQSISDAQSGAGDSTSMSGSVGFSGRLATVGWGLDFSRVISEQQDRPRSHNGRVTGSLGYSPDYEVQLALRAGTEVDDLRTGRSERTTTWGAGMVWAPGPRTTLSVDYDRRFFGRSHSVGFTHRMARTVLTFSDARSLDTTGISSRGALSNYDFFSQQLASITDPVLRDATVRQLLAANNLDPAGREIAAGFLTNGPTVQRSQNVSMTYQGLRATISLLAFQTWSTSLSPGSNAGGDLANGNPVHQRGLSASFTHRLTSDASLAISASLQKTASSGNQSGNDLRTITATWSARLGPYSNVSLGVRHAVADSDFNPYHESAVIGSIRMQF